MMVMMEEEEEENQQPKENEEGGEGTKTTSGAMPCDGKDASFFTVVVDLK